jgi:hypothetical protein
LAITTGGSERARIDSSGRLLVGTSTSSGQNSLLQVVGNECAQFHKGANDTAPSTLNFSKSRNTAYGSFTIVQDGDRLGSITFRGDDGTDYLSRAAEIKAEVDGTPGAGDMPGRLVFSTTADGASSPTERMRITSNGLAHLFKTASNRTVAGFTFNENGSTQMTRLDGSILAINRQSTDGTLVDFRQSDNLEGSISVSGTTVTYGGGHLARWSQLPNDEDPSGLLKGTVMSNLDEMCEWGEEDNEQLNKTKVSDIEGDPNVAGVFVSTSFDEDGPLDFFVAMTGDMIIRIAEGTAVQRGDLLMSAGDGTAKPQDDDIIRSKTIAKVTSTHVTCTYDDGSYCVPCVLMAC